jgi:hypothetical protein
VLLVHWLPAKVGPATHSMQYLYHRVTKKDKNVCNCVFSNLRHGCWELNYSTAILKVVYSSQEHQNFEQQVRKLTRDSFVCSMFVAPGILLTDCMLVREVTVV